MTENTAPTDAPTSVVPPVQPAPMLESEARTWSMLTHILAALAAVVSGGTLAFVVPLVIWLIFKDRSALVDFHGKQNLNLQLTVIVSGIAAAIVGTLLFVVGLAVTLPLWGLYVLYALVISIVAGIKAHEGQYYRIPFMISFVR